MPRHGILASHRIVHLTHEPQNGGPLEDDSVLRTCGNELAQEGAQRPPGVPVPCDGPADSPSTANGGKFDYFTGRPRLYIDTIRYVNIYI